MALLFPVALPSFMNLHPVYHLVLSIDEVYFVAPSNDPPCAPSLVSTCNVASVSQSLASAWKVSSEVLTFPSKAEDSKNQIATRRCS